MTFYRPPATYKGTESLEDQLNRKRGDVAHGAKPTADDILHWIARERQTVSSGGGNLVMAEAIIKQACGAIARAKGEQP